MKELSIEEKAKAYDEAIKKAESLYKAAEPMSGCNVIIETLFPELKESEDERIRKEMIFYFTEEIPQCSIQEHSDKMREFISWLKRQEVERTKLELKSGNSYFCYKSRWERADSETFKKGLIYKCNKDGVLDNFVIKNPEQHFIEIKDERIAWLEKQYEQKHTPKHKIGDTIYYNSFGEVKSMVVSDVVMDSTDDPMYEDKEGNAVFEKDLIEQKPIDKVEPKFRNGEWITNGEFTWYIKKVGNGFYDLKSPDGRVVDDTISHVDGQFHSFTTQDAKDGDVLVTHSGIVFIFKNIMEGATISFHAALSTPNFASNTKIHISEDNEQLGDQEVFPATKEQREQLEKAMADAGYTFDFEKKELKKISQRIISAEAKEAMYGKPAWSEEDEETLDYIITYIEKNKSNTIYTKKTEVLEGMVAWLKSLKERVQPQQEWDEEEIEKAAQEWDSKANFNPFYMTMDGDNPTGIKQDITTHKESFKAGIRWILKSLRPQPHWKPSEPDILLLERIANGKSNPQDFQASLCGLIGNLKKLREEDV